MNPSAFIPDVAEVLAARLVWEVDPEDELWLRAVFEEAYVYMRMNDFPDRNLYSLYVGEGRFYELEDLKPTWERSGPPRWPPTARRRTPHEYM